jgi:F-type H+-transporting ATPase subunit b
MFLSLDGTFWVQLFNFAIFFALLNVLFLRPVGRAIRKRREYIDGVVSGYAKYQSDAKALRERAERIRADARREAEQKIARARADASNEAAELAARFSEQVQSTVEEAQRNAGVELERARAGEGRLVEQLSDLMVDRSLGTAAR